jgi:hypothetical protein
MIQPSVLTFYSLLLLISIDVDHSPNVRYSIVAKNKIDTGSLRNSRLEFAEAVSSGPLQGYEIGIVREDPTLALEVVSPSAGCSLPFVTRSA